MYIKQTRQQLKIVDNFLESPGLWKEFALNQEYFKDESNAEHLLKPSEDVYKKLRNMNEIIEEPYLMQPDEFW